MIYHDDAPMTKGDYRMLNQRLYDILSRSFAFMTIKCEELITSHQVTIQKLVQSNAETLAYQKQLVEDSSQLIVVASSKVFKIVFDINNMETKHDTFMNSFQTIFDNNASKVNKVILSFRTSFQNERESLSGHRFGMQRDNDDHHTSVSNSILTL